MALCWNCRGLGNSPTVRTLISKVRENSPRVVFLAETRLLGSRLDGIRQRIGFHGGLAVDREGLGGGLMLLWSDAVDVTILGYSSRYIDAEIHDRGRRWRFTGFYGEPVVSNRHRSWQLLRDLSHRNDLPWLCAGDFNEIMYQEEKEGGDLRPSMQMEVFRSAAEDSGLWDLGFTGNPFTWTKTLQGKVEMVERLDRALANSAWRDLYPGYRVYHLAATRSDHCVLHIQWESREEIGGRDRRPRLFRFESFWSREEDCTATITRAWGTDAAVLDMAGTVKAVASALQDWNMGRFSGTQKRIAGLRRRLQALQGRSLGDRELSEEVRVRSDLERLLQQEDDRWRQRAQVHWWTEGDRNTAFFHRYASVHRRANQILQLEDPGGVVRTAALDIGNIIQGFYKELYSSNGCTGLDEVVPLIRNRVSEADYSFLDASFRPEEVWEAIKQMHPSKSPGPDGLPAMFYQRYWQIVGPQVTRFVLGVLNNDGNIDAVNKTFITLIPKVQNPSHISQFRPISLCNVIYKVVSKVVTNRLRIVVPRITSVNQSAFLKDRLISDNVIVAFETLHHMRSKTAGKKGEMAAKIDMMKAYDRVEWNYLEAVLVRMGFPSRITGIIMRCVRSVSFQVLLNGCPLPEFSPSRGLRQGDPLSPFLFVLCAEGLSALLQDAASKEVFKGVKVCRLAPMINHLFYADDSLLFSEASLEQARALGVILHKYGTASGQGVNFAKSSIYFSPNTRQEVRDGIKQHLGISEVGDLGVYLGVPSQIGRERVREFRKVVDRLWTNVNAWSGKSLSRAGREILLKAVGQAIPVYIMSVFKLPRSITEEFTRIIRRFWWRGGRQGGGFHWLGWNTLCRSKKEGGLGFRDIEVFNDALLAKQGWRLLTKPDSLATQVLKAKYFPNSTFLEAELGYRPSQIWRSFFGARWLLLRGVFRQVGNGLTTVIGDRWVPKPPEFTLSRELPLEWKHCPVHDLIREDSLAWDPGKVRHLGDEEMWQIVAKIPLVEGGRDRWSWFHTKDGCYTVKSGYHVAMSIKYPLIDGESIDNLWQKIWELNLPPKIRMFIWRVKHDSLPTREKLRRRGMEVVDNCPVCGNDGETLLHILKECVVAQRVWDGCPGLNHSDEMGSVTVQQWVQNRISKLNSGQRQEWAFNAWTLWNGRNEAVFDHRVRNPAGLGREATAALAAFRAASAAQGIARGCAVRAAERQLGDTAGRGQMWRRPEMGWLKINTDASIQGNKIGLGIVARDCEGIVRFAECSGKVNARTVLEAEGLAVLQALRTGQELGVRNIIVESDCLNLINQCNSRCFDNTSGGIIAEACSRLALAFDNCIFQHCNRTLNYVAHHLARYANFLQNSRRWMDSVPNHIEPLLAHDISLME